jgi:hypothetical protein
VLSTGAVVESCWLTSADAGRDDAEDGGDEYDSSDIIFAGVYFLPLIVRMRTTTTTTVRQQNSETKPVLQAMLKKRVTPLERKKTL